MSFEEIEARKAEINAALDTATKEELDAFEEEIRSLNAEIEKLKNAEAEKAEARKAVAEGSGEKIIPVEERRMENIEVRNTKEYIDEFAEYIKTEKRGALISENATNGTVPVPELVDDIVRTAWEKDDIMRLVKKSYIKGNLKVGFEISSTGATVHTEGASAVSEETLVLGIVNLVPASIKKWISVSDEVMDLRGEAFLTYVYNELAYQIAHKAAEELIDKIEACGTASTTTCPSVQVLTESSVAVGTIAKALGKLSDQASNPVIMMNKQSWSAFKEAQYANKFSVDPFEGRQVVFNNHIKAYSAATTGDTYCIVGDLGYGALANFPAGQEINFKFDELSLAASDLVKVIGREFVGLGVVAPDAFAQIQK